MNKLKNVSMLVLLTISVLCGSSAALATSILGSNLESFTVLGATTVTNVPTSTIVGNVGVWSSGGANAITGFNSSPGVGVSDSQVTGGSVYAGGALAQSAQSELTTARNILSSFGPGITLINPDLAGLILAPGVYTVAAGTTNLSGLLTLDGGNNANAAWIFQLPSTLITSENSVVEMTHSGSGAGVYWNVGSSATIEVNTTFMGNILALTSIDMKTSATDFCGRALADNGAVTLDQNSLSGVCSGTLEGSNGLNGGFDVTTTAAGDIVVTTLPYAYVPEPTTLTLLGLGLVGFMARRRVQGLRAKS